MTMGNWAYNQIIQNFICSVYNYAVIASSVVKSPTKLVRLGGPAKNVLCFAIVNTMIYHRHSKYCDLP